MKNDLICFSHLRWNFVYQRPQHLMSRAARIRRVFYIEEPVFISLPDKLKIVVDPVNQVIVVTPELTNSRKTGHGQEIDFRIRMRRLLDLLFLQYGITDFVSWYYAPMALSFSEHLKPMAVVYDCMDELSAFKFAPAELVEFEQKLMAKADIMFTGGHRLYQAKKAYHRNIYSFPSAIDKTFFYPARTGLPEMDDQISIPHPRLGFFGVIDERFDIDLVRRMAELKPEWQFIFIGPVVKIEESALPGNKNIHYLGMKDYKDLPTYISGWDLCIMPFAINASTEFISPTKTPEFLAAGKKVISTPIHDVVNPYGAEGLVGIAETAEKFIEIAEHDLRDKTDPLWLGKVDQYLSTISWNKTWKNMDAHIKQILKEKHTTSSGNMNLRENISRGGSGKIDKRA